MWLTGASVQGSIIDRSCFSLSENWAAQQMRSRLLGGARPPLDNLTAAELTAAQDMILKGEAEIACYACRLFLIAKPA